MCYSPKVSVIVPVYKAEAYLHQCVDSLLVQTFQDFEVLLVDDGSPDHSGEICDEYARQDSRVRVIHKQNGGVSSARQCGLDNARGEYTIHADPDDWVESGMLEALYQKAKADDADMVICDFYIEQNGRQTYSKQQPSALDHETVLRELFQQLHGSCCNKLVKRACYNAYCIRFPKDFSFCEDLYVNASLLKHNLHVTYIPKAFYHYTQVINANSLVCKYNSEVQEQDRILLEAIDRLLQDSPVHEIAYRHIASMIVIRAFYARIDTAYSFWKKFHHFSFDVYRCHYERFAMRLLLLIACCGFYPLAYTILQIYKKLK